MMSAPIFCPLVQFSRQGTMVMSAVFTKMLSRKWTLCLLFFPIVKERMKTTELRMTTQKFALMLLYPYLKLTAEANNVGIEFLNMGLNYVRRRLLKDIDTIIGADVCFNDILVDPMRRFILRAKKASVTQVILSDPGRSPFDDLAELFIRKHGTEFIDWKINRPVKARGRILKLTL